MSEAGFRQATDSASEVKAPAPKAKDPKVAGTSEDIVDEAPIVLYEQTKGYPYSAEYFDVLEIYKDPDIGLDEEIENIEDAYREKVVTGELEDSKKSFEVFIKEAEKATDTKYASKVVKIAKIAEWMKFMNNLKGIDKNRSRYGK